MTDINDSEVVPLRRRIILRGTGDMRGDAALFAEALDGRIVAIREDTTRLMVSNIIEYRNTDAVEQDERVGELEVWSPTDTEERQLIPRIDSLADAERRARSTGRTLGEVRMHPVALLLLDRQLLRRDPLHGTYFGARSLMPLRLFGARVVEDVTVPIRRASVTVL